MQLWCRSVHLDGNTVLAYLSWRVAWTSHSWCGLSFLLWWQINLCPWSVNYCPSLSQPGTASLCTLCQLHPHSLLSLPQSLPVLSLSFSTFSFSVNICSFLLLSLSFRLPWCLLFSKLSLQLFYHLFFFLYLSSNSYAGTRCRQSKATTGSYFIRVTNSCKAVSHRRLKAN